MQELCYAEACSLHTKDSGKFREARKSNNFCQN